MEYYVLALLIIGGFMAIYFKKEAVPENNSEELKLRISEL